MTYSNCHFLYGKWVECKRAQPKIQNMKMLDENESFPKLNYHDNDYYITDNIINGNFIKENYEHNNIIVNENHSETLVNDKFKLSENLFLYQTNTKFNYNMELKAKKRKLMSENIIKKIKSRFFRYIKNIIKKNSINNNINLLIPQYKIVDISSKSNKKLFYMKIKDIYLEATKNNLYSDVDKDHNKRIIKKIYK
jgi:hypothetical protein